MRLTNAQLQDFAELGDLFPPDVFTADETGILIREAHQIFDSTRSDVVRAKDEKTTRTATLRRLCRFPTIACMRWRKPPPQALKRAFI